MEAVALEAPAPLDSEDDDPKSPERRCLATGERRPKDRLLRFVLDPDGVVTPDLEQRLPGRGLWVAAERGALQQAVARKLFSRAAKAQATIPPGLVDRVADLAGKRCLALIGLGRRAGALAHGFDRVEIALKRAHPAVLIEAADGAEDGRRRLRALAPGAFVVDMFDAASLGRAIGAPSIVVHAALAPGGVADKLVVAATQAAALARPKGGADGTGLDTGTHRRIADQA